MEGVRQQLRSGANINARDQHGQTALMLAAHHGHSEVVETLVGAGADLNVTALMLGDEARVRVKIVGQQ